MKAAFFRPWRRLNHPQLGEVEAGGLDPRIGVWNPSLGELSKLCAQHSPAFLRVAALAPALRIERVSVSALGGDVCRVELSIANHGYLATWILESAKSLELNEPVSIFCEPEGATLVDPGQAQVHVGHLEGWGRGLHSGVGAVHDARSSGSGHRAHASYLVRGRGALRFRVGSCRVGWIEQRVEVDAGEHG